MCDTFVALHKATADGSVIFGKNSDREANEAQILECHPPGSYPPGTKLKCTYLEIPQIEKTYATIISRPFWMWGAEMGLNEKGLTIGNEAVFTKIKVEKKGVLTGMDLLRLALERSGTAVKAKQLIIDLIQQYGQGGICGFEDKKFVYHNSYIIADKKEAWVLETAGKFWVAKKITDYYAISNGLSIGSDYDEIHPGAEKYARKKGWAKGVFNFADAFSDFLFTKFSACKTRRGRASYILKKNNQNISVKSAMAHLRDHILNHNRFCASRAGTPLLGPGAGGGKCTKPIMVQYNAENYKPSKPFLSNTICAHAANALTRNASQTTGSMIVHLAPEATVVWATATSAPCISMFKPIWFGQGNIPGLVIKPSAHFNANSFWWKHELLHREIIKDYQSRIKIIKNKRDIAENELLDLVYNQNKKGIKISQTAFDKHQQLIDEWTNEIKNTSIKNPPGYMYRNYWKKLNKRANMPL
ncbi:MAG TPA: hypothetical protein ENJ95_03320 [Bacteroidetes bacterium]|nr:hypothetical protein [Bacteroidota bacterium]